MHNIHCTMQVSILFISIYLILFAQANFYTSKKHKILAHFWTLNCMVFVCLCVCVAILIDLHVI